MAWYDKAVFYHIYPLGLTGAPAKNSYTQPVNRLRMLYPWIDHIRELGCTGLYIGPLFESVGHGYETTDYRKTDSRLGTNEDLKQFTGYCHASGIRVIFDGVFNHTGRDFFAFRDILEHREHSRYLNWYCNVDFCGNNEYNDGFSYANWGGFNLLAKLNLRNPEVRDYLLDTVRFWVSEFDIDGLRLDAADVLDFDFMKSLRGLARELKEEFWLMGEVIHGEYSRWANADTLHSVTNYHLHKALYSAHNDHNYFEIAHTVKRQMDMGIGQQIRLYNFADNHDVERIWTRLRNKAHYVPLHILLYTLPGIPSVYYGSEFGIEGRKERYSDASLRPCLDLAELRKQKNACFDLLKALGRIHNSESALWYGDYRELQLTTGKYAFARGDLIITVNNEDNRACFDLQTAAAEYYGALTGQKAAAENGMLHLEIDGNSGEIWIPCAQNRRKYEPVIQKPESVKEERSGRTKASSKPAAAGTRADTGSGSAKGETERIPERAKTPKSFEEMTIPELQAEVFARLVANGPVTDRMKQDVLENVYRDSLINWIRSFQR